MAFGVIGQGEGTARQMELQRELGNVQADVKDGGVVLTHTCGIRATMRDGSCRAQATVRVWDNGRAWNTLDERITPKRMQRTKVPTRTVASRPAGREATPAWLAFASLPSRTDSKIQGRGRVRPGDDVSA